MRMSVSVGKSVQDRSGRTETAGPDVKISSGQADRDGAVRWQRSIRTNPRLKSIPSFGALQSLELLFDMPK